MILNSPDPVAISLLGFNIYWYGIILAFAVLTGVLYANNLCKRFSLPQNFWIDNSPFIIITGVLGARLYYCLINSAYYFENPVQILDIRQGGLSVHGMLLVGLIYLFFLARRKNLRFWDLTDSISCAIPLSQAIGRWGNFFNSEAFGIPTNGEWGLYIPQANRPDLYTNYELFHPTFLYESIADIIIFIILIFISRKNNLKAGTITLIYLILYSFIRIIVESLRTDSALNIGGIPVAQIVSAIIIIICTVILIAGNRD